MNQKLRSEISDEFKWDLTKIYSSKELFDKDLIICEVQIIYMNV